MLSGHTKPIITYGKKRTRRIGNVADKDGSTPAKASKFSSSNPSSTPTPSSEAAKAKSKPYVLISQRRENNVPTKPKSSPKAVRGQRKVPGSSPLGGPKQKKPSQKAASVPITIDLTTTPVRPPLLDFRTNVPIPIDLTTPPSKPKRKPPLASKGKAKVTPEALRKPFSPFVDVDIVVLDDAGRRVSQEHRINRTDVQSNPQPRVPASSTMSDDDDTPILKKTSRWRARKVVLSEDEDEVETPEPKRISKARSSKDGSQAGSRKAPIVLSSSDEESDVEILSKPPMQLHVPKRAPTGLSSASASQPLSARPLTPIRNRSAHADSPAPASVPETPSTASSLHDFAALELSPSTQEALAKELLADKHALRARQPGWLLPLLDECGQAAPHEFRAFIESFPFDPIVYPDDDSASRDPTRPTFRKIGEASYSEVFGIGDVVLKVIPLRDPAPKSNSSALWEQEDAGDAPPPSDAADVLREIAVTRALGEMCAGFTRMLRAYVVRGRYPDRLLALWDEFAAQRGSESARPDAFRLAQTYAIIVLPNGGPDLEAYVFERSLKNGWKQAASVFWQVVRTLAQAEELVRFEHRDLHWGQILVKNIPPAVASLERTPLAPRNGRARATKAPMDTLAVGVRATVIDMGLARMDADENAYSTALEDEIFEGEGDYQFDVYRMMRAHCAGEWEGYRPLTNVMWLHYLTLKLLRSKSLRPPIAKKTPAPTSAHAFTEKECYDCLVEVEAKLGEYIGKSCKGALKKTKGRKTAKAAPETAGAGPNCAGDVLRLGAAKGWIQP